mgnify:CR=1 FL=1
MPVPDPRSPSRLLEGLNPEQLAAVTLPEDFATVFLARSDPAPGGQIHST